MEREETVVALKGPGGVLTMFTILCELVELGRESRLLVTLLRNYHTCDTILSIELFKGIQYY